MVIDEERISVPSVIRLVAVGTLSARAPAIFFFRRQSYTFFPTFRNIFILFLVRLLFDYLYRTAFETKFIQKNDAEMSQYHFFCHVKLLSIHVNENRSVTVRQRNTLERVLPHSPRKTSSVPLIGSTFPFNKHTAI